MEKQPRVRKDGKPFGSPHMRKDGTPRMSRSAELKLHNGESIKDKPEDQQPEKQPEMEAPLEAPIEGEQQEQQEQPKLLLLPATQPEPLVRKIKISATIDQKGITDKDGKLVDPNSNILKVITYESEGAVVNIAGVAGRMANDLNDWYEMAKRSKGINRSAGFNVNLTISDETNSEKIKELYTSISKIRLTNPIDIAFSIGAGILTQLEGVNAEAYTTGDFKVGVDGQLFLGKLKFNTSHLNLPLHVIKTMLQNRRREINNNVKANKRLAGIAPVKKLA